MSAPQTEEGAAVWDLFRACERQVRSDAMGKPTGLDFNAVFTMASALGIDPALIAELLPAAEFYMLCYLRGVICGQESSDPDRD